MIKYKIGTTEIRSHYADFKLSKQQTFSNYSYAAVSVYASLFAMYGP